MTLLEEKLRLEGKIEGLKQAIQTIQNHKKDPERVIVGIKQSIDLLKKRLDTVNSDLRSISKHL